MDMDDLIAEGQRLFSQTKFDEAAAVFTKALEMDPDDVGLLVTRGATLITLGQYAEAFADFDRAVQLKPDSARLYFRRGMGRMAQMDFEAAIVDFSRAIDLDHSYAVAFYCRGMAYDSLGKATGVRGRPATRLGAGQRHPPGRTGQIRHHPHRHGQRAPAGMIAEGLTGFQPL